MEVAPQELAQLLKLAGVGVGPEPDMPGAEIEPEVSVMAIPSDDGAPVGGGCGAPEPEHDHDHGGRMRGIIDMLQGAGEEPIEVEESPPKDDYENASNEFTGHPVDVVDTYDQYSYEPAKNSGMQRRTNSYGDNPLREDELIKEYTEFKKMNLAEWELTKPSTWFGGDDKKAPVNTKPIQKRGTTSDAGGDSREIANKGKFVGQGFGGPKGNTFTKTGDPNEIHTIPGQQQTVRDQNALSKAPATSEIEQHKKYADWKTKLAARRAERKNPATATATAGKALDTTARDYKKSPRGSLASDYGITNQGSDVAPGVAPGKAVTSVVDPRSTASQGPTAAEIKTYNDPRRTASQGPTADEIKMHRTKRGPETFRGNDIDTMKHAERWRDHPEAVIPNTTVQNPDDDQTIGQQVPVTQAQKDAAIAKAQPYSRQNDWATEPGGYYDKQGDNYVTDPAIAPPVNTSADDDDTDEYDSSQDDNSSAIAGAAIEPGNKLASNTADALQAAGIDPGQVGAKTSDASTTGTDATADALQAAGIDPGQVGANKSNLTIPTATKGGEKKVSMGDASISDTTGKVSGPEQLSPKKGTRIEDFYKTLGYPNLKAFLTANPEGVNKTNSGKLVVHPNKTYKPYIESVGLSRNINRLKVLAGI
tara:strand:- start:669 stop:2612 length:1944 start_codon:yes stop_codon:yes gene_type:complete